MSSLGIAKAVFGLCVVATLLLGSCTAKPYSEHLHGLYGSRPMVVCADGHSTYQHIKQVATILPLTKYIATLVHPLATKDCHKQVWQRQNTTPTAAVWLVLDKMSTRIKTDWWCVYLPF